MLLTTIRAKQNTTMIRPDDQVRFACPNFDAQINGWGAVGTKAKYKNKRFLT